MTDFEKLTNRNFLDFRKTGKMTEGSYYDWFLELKKRLELKQFRNEEIDWNDKFCIMFSFIHFQCACKEIADILDSMRRSPLPLQRERVEMNESASLALME